MAARRGNSKDAGAIHVRTDFDPVRHGFLFKNTFPVTFADVGLPFSGKLGQGLCGGMSLHAKRLFEEGRPIPRDCQPPAKESSLYATLWRRQIESLLPTTWARFIAWQARPDVGDGLPVGPIGRVTKREWPRLRRLLDDGEPVLLGLIRQHSKNPARAGVNHQVLVTGYRYEHGPRRLQLEAYDPNHPGRVVHLWVDMSKPGHRIEITQSTGEAVRGFFVTAAQ